MHANITTTSSGATTVDPDVERRESVVIRTADALRWR